MRVLMYIKYIVGVFAFFGSNIPYVTPVSRVYVDGSLLEPLDRPKANSKGPYEAYTERNLELLSSRRQAKDTRNMKNASQHPFSGGKITTGKTVSLLSPRRVARQDDGYESAAIPSLSKHEFHLEVMTASVDPSFREITDDPPTTSLPENVADVSMSGNESFDISWINKTDQRESSRLGGWADVALVTLFSSVIAGTVAGNMLVIAAVITTRRLRTVTNCFVMSLAVADWLVGMFVMPPKVFLYLEDNKWEFGRLFCELWISLDILLCTASILSLCAISIDRYLAITRPLAYSRRRRSKRLALSMISCVWIAAVVITSPPIFGWYEEKEADDTCEYNENTGYVVYSALGSFFLPLLVMLYVYARIACVITRRQRSIQKLQARGDRKSQYCGSDAEEPLHQKDRDEDGKRVESMEKPSQGSTKLSPSSGDAGGGVENRPQRGHERVSDKLSTVTQSEQDKNCRPETITGGSGFLGRFGISSCTSSNPTDGGDHKEIKNNKRFGERLTRHNTVPERGGMCLVENPAMTISLPDPETLASMSGTTENSTSCCSEQDNKTTRTPGTTCVASKQQQYRSTGGNNVGKMKTGSRLCHHSIATASPQKSIPGMQPISTSSGRNLADEESRKRNEMSCRSLERSSRVWTVETTPPSAGKMKGIDGGADGKTTTNNKNQPHDQELTEATQSSTDRSLTQMESVMMECSPAGNPASLMGAASAGAGNSGILAATVHDNTKRGPHFNRSQAGKMYTPQSSNLGGHQRIIQNNQLAISSSHHSSPTPTTPSATASSIIRAKSMKFVPHFSSSNDQNHNGGTGSRGDFSSGRIASFKRETKTAQTLAAVVGGFIICWLPFFVAYVMAPFYQPLTTGQMDALIWLGWSNSAINPFIYAFYSPDFRSAFWRLTVHKCEAIVRNRHHARNSPRRYEDPPHHHQTNQNQVRTST